METMTNPCACKGIRTCLLCEEATFSNQIRPLGKKAHKRYLYCEECKAAFLDTPDVVHPEHKENEAIDFPGISLIHDFVSLEEERWLLGEIDKTPWICSQSGRRKQDYGPKVNFKKHKVKTEVFSGLPSFSKILVERMQSEPLLESFIPIELCNLDYCPDRGAAIDAHIDDVWLWGERLVTLNLLAPTVYTMTRDSEPDVQVNVCIPQRSLVVVHGIARYDWKHAVERENIPARRLGMTFRELTPEFMQDGKREGLGKELINIALAFQGVAVGVSPGGNLS